MRAASLSQVDSGTPPATLTHPLAGTKRPASNSVRLYTAPFKGS